MGPLDDPHWSVGKLLQKWALARPKKAAVIIDDAVTSYRELDQLCNQVCHAFLDQGIKRGDRVANLTANTIESVAVYFACAKMGLVFVPLNNRLTEKEIAYQVGDSGASMIVFDGKFAPLIKSVADESNLQSENLLGIGLGVGLDIEEQDWCMSFETVIASCSDNPPLLQDTPRLSDPLAIIYTSGTTGAPKGAITNHLQTYFKCFQVMLYGDLREDDVYLSHAPLFHSAGLFISLTPSIMRGITLVTSKSFDPERFISDAKKYRATISGGASTMLRMVLQKYDDSLDAFESMRVFIGGGERTAKSLLEELERRTGMRLRMLYGQTENSFMTLQSEEDVYERFGSVGRPGFMTEVWIENDEGEPVAAGETGNIMAAGPTVMSGYWKLEEKTKETIVDGKLDTGDLGYMDEQGCIYLVDRAKDMYRSGAENVYPAEVERVVMDCEGVANASIIGVPDNTWGEVGHAFVVNKPDHEVTQEAILAHLEGKLARYKFPKHFTFLDELPITESGKVKKVDLKRMLGVEKQLQVD